jgi:hypothetical protein
LIQENPDSPLKPKPTTFLGVVWIIIYNVCDGVLDGGDGAHVADVAVEGMDAALRHQVLRDLPVFHFPLKDSATDVAGNVEFA